MTKTLFATYALPLQFFSQILQNSPDRDLLGALTGGHTADSLLADLACWDALRPCASAGADLDTQASVAALLTAYAAPSPTPCTAPPPPDLDALYLALHTDHLHLFSGPQPHAPPWESVWREKDRLLFGDCTEAVANIYLDWGIRIENAGHEPEDHLGLELAFCLYLLQLMEENPNMTGASGASPRAALSSFVREHVLLWADECLRAAAGAATTPFYAHMSLLCCTLLHNLAADLEKE